MDTTQTSDKLVRFGRVLDIVGKVFAVLCILAGVSCFFLAILVLLLPQDLLFNAMSTVELTSGFFVFQTGTVLSDLVPHAALIGVKLAMIFALLGGLVYCAASAIILFILSAIFKSTAARRSPFLPENVKRLKIIGIILIVASLFLGLDNLIFAFCVLALAFVFQYGTELQQQADETF